MLNTAAVDAQVLDLLGAIVLYGSNPKGNTITIKEGDEGGAMKMLRKKLIFKELDDLLA